MLFGRVTPMLSTKEASKETSNACEGEDRYLPTYLRTHGTEPREPLNYYYI